MTDDWLLATEIQRPLPDGRGLGVPTRKL